MKKPDTRNARLAQEFARANRSKKEEFARAISRYNIAQMGLAFRCFGCGQRTASSIYGIRY